MTMLQITLDKPGSFSQREVARPVPEPEHALVRVHRIGVCGTDLHAFAGCQPYFEYPRVLGHELGVEVLEAPANSQGIRPGDHCAVRPYLHCGRCIACRRGRTNCCTSLKVMGVHVNGGMAPLLAVPVANLHRSDTLSLDQLALVETLTIGAHAVERAQAAAGGPGSLGGPGENALVIGTGPIGLGVLQFLLAAEARVTVMDVSASRLDFCRSHLGIERTILAGQPDTMQQLLQACDGELPTLVIDATGNASSMAGCFELAAHGGRIVFVGLFQGDVTFHDPNFHKRELTLMSSRNATAATFEHVIQAVESGHVDTTPWITHRLDLPQVTTDFATLPTREGLIKAVIHVA